MRAIYGRHGATIIDASEPVIGVVDAVIGAAQRADGVRIGARETAGEAPGRRRSVTGPGTGHQ